MILYLLIIRYKTSATTKSNEDIPMQHCEPYTLHQFKSTDDVEYKQTIAVYETLSIEVVN